MDRQTQIEWNEFQRKHMNPPLLTVHMVVNSTHNASALIDSGCLCYALVSKKFVRRSRLERFNIELRTIEGINGDLSEIDEVARFEIDMHGYKERAYAYVIDYVMEEDVVLGKGWMDLFDVTIAPKKKSLYIYLKGIRVRCEEGLASSNATQQVSAVTFVGLMRRAKN
jgi:hypothetical protein